jgi:hypothetical protein
MKIIDAVWEKRNLGVSAKEVSLDAGDTLADLEQLRGLGCEYAVVRVPAGEIEKMFKLEDMGYRYIETQFGLKHNLKDIESSCGDFTKRLMANLTYSPMNDEDKSELRRQLKLGMFTTDRIYADPGFTAEQSANRFVGWTTDEFARGAKAYKCMFEDKAVGFFLTRRQDNNVFYAILAGLYDGYKTSGLGLGVFLSNVIEAAKQGGSRIETSVSSNNLLSLKTHLMAGYHVVSLTNVYVKHN